MKLEEEPDELRTILIINESCLELQLCQGLREVLCKGSEDR